MSVWWHALNAGVVLGIKIGVSVAAAIVLAAGALLAWKGRAHVLARTRGGLLAALGITAFCAYFNFFHFHYDDPLHEWDIFHYYIGGKYLPELGYTRLYTCAIAAERDLDGAIDNGRTIRNLETNDLENVAHFASVPCRERFSDERWREFEHDIDFFRKTLGHHRYTYEVLHDHGFNGTPVWSLLGRGLASTAEASHAQLVWLSLLDPLLLVAMWLAVAWAFGWRVACVGAIWWGTSWPTQFFWTGGAFLRMDWLAALVIGVCLVKKERPLAGGAALAYSALVRIFPGFVLAVFVLKHVIACVRARKLAIPRVVVGAALATAVLVPAALVIGGNNVGEFVANSEKHLATPLTNNMGLKTVIAYDADTRASVAKDPHAVDEFGAWKQARRDTFAARRWLFYVLVVAFLVLLALATRETSDWVTLVLGVGLIPVAAELTCYYYGFLLLYAALWPARALVGVGLCVVAFASDVIAWLAPWDDARYYDISVYVLLLATAVTTLYALRPKLQSAPANSSRSETAP